MNTKPCHEHVSGEKITNYALIAAIYSNGVAKKFNLNPTTLLVLIGLANHFNYKKSVVFPHQSYLAEQLNISERSVIRAIKDLLSKNLVLKSKKGNGTNSNIYCFTNIFFEALKMSPNKCQDDSFKNDSLSASCHEQEKKNKINNNKVLNFQKNVQEPKYLSVETTKKGIEEKQNLKLGSPLDYNFEQAKEFLDNLLPELRNTFFAKELRKKWNL